MLCRPIGLGAFTFCACVIREENLRGHFNVKFYNLVPVKSETNKKHFYTNSYDTVDFHTGSLAEEGTLRSLFNWMFRNRKVSNQVQIELLVFEKITEGET